MDVILGAVGIVKVDDEFDVFDVNATSGDVRGDEDVDVGRLELVQHVLAFVLLLVAVNRRHLPSASDKSVTIHYNSVAYRILLYSSPPVIITPFYF